MPHYGIDTSIFVRLLTGDPAMEFEQTKRALENILAEDPTSEIEVSNMVIAEAYFVLQHHYGISKDMAKAALISVLTSGLVKSQSGRNVLDALRSNQEPGLIDRLIVDHYASHGMTTLTHDKKMGRLSSARVL